MKSTVLSGMAIPLVIFTSAMASTIADPGPWQSASGLPELAEPFAILADGDSISVDIGHAAPFVYDFNKDGRKDLIVGQFGGGKARIYLNHGTDSEPEFDGFTYLQAAGEDATMDPG